MRAYIMQDNSNGLRGIPFKPNQERILHMKWHISILSCDFMNLNASTFSSMGMIQMRMIEAEKIHLLDSVSSWRRGSISQRGKASSGSFLASPAHHAC